MKKHLLFFFLFPLLFALKVSAQINYYKLSVGAGLGATRTYGDLPLVRMRESIILNSDLYLTPYLNGGLEVQVGTLKGLEMNQFERHYENHYKLVSAIGKVHAGEFMPGNIYHISNAQTFRNVLKGFYVGTGAGIVFSQQKNTGRTPVNMYTRGTETNKELFIPVSFGIDNSGFMKKVVVGINYQMHFVLGDQIDGYNIAGGRNDLFSVVSFGMKYKFGKWGLY